MDEKLETLSIFSEEDKKFILSLIEQYNNASDEALKKHILNMIGLYSNPFMQITGEPPTTPTIR